MQKTSFIKEVWSKLSKLDVSEKVEKKNIGGTQLSYLSWANGWEILMDHYPESTYQFREISYFPDGSGEVWVEITVQEDEKSVTREMWLPIMDNRNKSVQSPGAREINDTRMRALVKCLAMFGLGLYLYAGEDVPSNGLSPVWVTKAPALVQSKQYKELINLMKAIDNEELLEHWQKIDSTSKRLIKEVQDAERIALKTKDLLENGDPSEAQEAMAELNNIEKKLFWDMLNAEQQKLVKEMKEQAA
jgi:hypothetical protein